MQNDKITSNIGTQIAQAIGMPRQSIRKEFSIFFLASLARSRARSFAAGVGTSAETDPCLLSCSSL